MNEERLKKILKEMEEQKTPQLLVSDPASLFYLTNMWVHPGERMIAFRLSLTAKPVLIANKLFQLTDAPFEVVEYDDTEDSVALLAKYLDEDDVIGVDKNWPAHFLLRLMKQIPTGEFINGSTVIDVVRGKKDMQEIALMREVSHDNDCVMAEIKTMVTENSTELELTQKLHDLYLSRGNAGFSFDPIVAYGKNTADPHHMTDDSTVKVGDSIVFDIGGTKNSYCSDMTRTFFYKSVSKKSREVYETVLEANKRAIAKVKPGVKFSEIDAAARDYITEKGYGEYFTHRTGHFIGIECHEAGDVSAVNQSVVEPGMIFSIEPGIYIQGEVGVRIEDLVVATEDGCEVLNQYPKELTIIG